MVYEEDYGDCSGYWFKCSVCGSCSGFNAIRGGVVVFGLYLSRLILL